MSENFLDDLDLDPSTESDEKNWLERMHSLLEWQVVYPKCNNPFETPLSDKALHELATRKDILLRYAELRGKVDGDEILIIKDLNAGLTVITDHPAILTLTKAEVRKYLEQYGINKLIDKELDNAQKEYKQELKKRLRKRKKRSSLLK